MVSNPLGPGGVSAGSVTGAHQLTELLEDQAFLWHEAMQEVTTMQDRLLRRREVEEITALSRSSIYRLMQEGEFPRPVKVGPAAVRWRLSDINTWLESRSVATVKLNRVKPHSRGPDFP